MWPNRRKLRIWSHLLKKPLIKNFIFCAVKRYHICLTGSKMSLMCMYMIVFIRQPTLANLRRGTFYLVSISTKLFTQSFTKYWKLNMKSVSHGCFEWKKSDNCNCQLDCCNSCHSSSCPSDIPKIKVKVPKLFSTKFVIKH